MTAMAPTGVNTRAALVDLLDDYSAEVTARDKKGLDAAAELMAPGREVFIAAIPGETLDRVVAMAVRIRKAGLVPVPHIAARNLESLTVFEDLIARLVGEAGLDRALVLGGDRDKPAGAYDSSLQLIQTGVFQRNGVHRIGLACYPEGHPRLPDPVLEAARADKLVAAEQAGLDVWLTSQFCFDPKPILALAERMRAQGVKAPFRVGVAGPAEHATLIRYALMCGVGASMRALKERQDLARSVLSGETPEALLTEVAVAQSLNPALGISGVHFFTFGGLARSAQFASEHMR